MLSNSLNVEKPPDYNSIYIPDWIYKITREKSEYLLKQHKDKNNLWIYSDRLFLIRQKDMYGLYVISVYRFNDDNVYHYLLKQKNDHFLLNDNIIINTNDFNKLVHHLCTNVQTGYLSNGEIIPLVNTYLSK